MAGNADFSQSRCCCLIDFDIGLLGLSITESDLIIGSQASCNVSTDPVYDAVAAGPPVCLISNEVSLGDYRLKRLASRPLQSSPL